MVCVGYPVERRGHVVNPAFLSLLLALEIPFKVGVGAAAETNSMMIGDVKVAATNVGGRIQGERWIVVSNQLIEIHAWIEPIPKPVGVPSSTNSTPRLDMLWHTGTGDSQHGEVGGFRGFLYMNEAGQ